MLLSDEFNSLLQVMPCAIKWWADFQHLINMWSLKEVDHWIRRWSASLKQSHFFAKTVFFFLEISGDFVLWTIKNSLSNKATCFVTNCGHTRQGVFDEREK